MFRKIASFATEEYQIFERLPLRLRLKAVGALTITFLTLVLITHLALQPYLDGTDAQILLGLFYLFVGVVAILIILPILNKRFSKPATITLFVIALMSMSIYILIPLIFPRFHKYRAVFLGVGLFTSIVGGTLAIVADGREASILNSLPEPSSLLLWGASLTAVVFGAWQIDGG